MVNTTQTNTETAQELIGYKELNLRGSVAEDSVTSVD